MPKPATAIGKALLRIATDAQDADPRLVDFIEGLWRHCAEPRRCHCLESLTLSSEMLRGLKHGADTKLDGRRHAYQFFCGWLENRTYNGRPILALVSKGCAGEKEGEGSASVYRVNLPMCSGDPWPEVKAALPSPVPTARLALKHVIAIRLAVIQAAGFSVRSSRHTRQARLLQAARLAAYRALAPSSRDEWSICPLWPDEGRVDLALFDRNDTETLLLVLLVGTGRRAKELLPFAREALRADTTERVFLSLLTPAMAFKLRAAALGVEVVQVGGLIGAVQPAGLDVRRPRRRAAVLP
jgi:hypothetical protein